MSGKKTKRKSEKISQQIVEVSLKDLHEFMGHPFKVEMNSSLFQLMKSIEEEGVIVPGLVRPRPNGDGYEIIAGHRRKEASQWAGKTSMPVVVKEMDDNQAVIVMVDSNLQREHLKPSEKAYAYKMKLEAMKQQGKRNDLLLSNTGTEFENPTVELYTVTSGFDTEGKWVVNNGADIKTTKHFQRDENDHVTSVQDEPRSKGIRSNEILAKQVGESVAQIKRYIRLTNLIPKVLDMVDEGKIALTVAVELSYLNEEEQYELHAIMDMEQCTPSLSQANRMKRLSQSGELDMDKIYQILEQEKPNQREQIKIRADVLEQYFPDYFTPKDKVELIEKLVKEWHEEHQKNRQR